MHLAEHLRRTLAHGWADSGVVLPYWLRWPSRQGRHLGPPEKAGPHDTLHHIVRPCDIQPPHRQTDRLTVLLQSLGLGVDSGANSDAAVRKVLKLRGKTKCQRDASHAPVII